MKQMILIVALAVVVVLASGGDLYAQVKTAIRIEAMSPHRLHEMGFDNPNGHDNVTSGLPVVGKGTRVFLTAWNVSSDSLFLPGSAYLWELVSKPAGSATVLDSTAGQWTTFTADTNGSYAIRATVDGKDTSVTIIAASYIGADRNNVGGGALNCLTCHNPASSAVAAAWVTSGHATMFENGMNGGVSAFWGKNCWPCHTVGWNQGASNGGFDDVVQALGFVDTQWTPWRPGLYDSLLTTDKAKVSMVAGIGCENCHGPRSPSHASAGTQPKSFNSGVCGQCHDEPWRHNRNAQWENSGHAEPPWSNSFRSSGATVISDFTLNTCVRCHDGAAFAAFTKGGTFDNRTSSGYGRLSHTVIGCATCHEPHGGTLRVAPAAGDTLANGYNYASTDFGAGKLCVNCHKYRRNATTYVSGNMSNTWGPHYRGAADVFLAQNAETFGDTLPSSVGHSLVQGACVGCHMSATPDTGTAARDKIGGHSWNMEYEDAGMKYDNVTGCVGCHSGITEFSDITAAFDYDADGSVEAFQKEVEGLLERIEDILPPAGDPAVDRWLIASDPDSVNLKKVFYNYLYVTNDKSKGVHNPKYVIALLQRSLNQVTDIDFSGREPVPTEYLLSQNYPNPFNPVTRITVGLTKGSDVALTVYNLLGERVATLMDGRHAPGVYEVSWDGTDDLGNPLAGGIYFYRLKTADFTSVKKMVYMK